MPLKNFISYFLVLFSLFFFSLKIYLDKFFGVVDFEHFLIFVSFGLTGLLDSDDYIIIKFIQICIILPLVLILIFFGLIKFINSFNKIFFIDKAFQLVKKTNIYISFFLLLISIFFFLQSISFTDFLTKDNNEDFIKNNYVRPNQNDFLKKESSKNLILIYVESLEDLLLDEKFINKETINKLEFSEFNAKKFKNFRPTKYTNWTIGSIVATQCGLPQKPVGIFDTQKIKLNRNSPNKFGFGIKNFLPNALCLGDLLKISKYKNIYINAADFNFAATGSFFYQHGYDEIYGKRYFDKSEYKYDSYTWGGGPNDSILFDFAKKKIIDLKENNEKFNITILTTDTHEPGYIDNKCNYKINTNENRLSKALTCTTNVLSKFIEFIQNNFSEDVSIVILGDHLYPQSSHLNIENLEIERTIYNRIISNNSLIYRDLINHYDFFPTILNLLNFSFEENRLGLGFSASVKIDKDYYDNYFYELEKKIENKSDYYVEFWK